jgi:hypothetical protein
MPCVACAAAAAAAASAAARFIDGYALRNYTLKGLILQVRQAIALVHRTPLA